MGEARIGRSKNGSRGVPPQFDRSLPGSIAEKNVYSREKYHAQLDSLFYKSRTTGVAIDLDALGQRVRKCASKSKTLPPQLGLTQPGLLRTLVEPGGSRAPHKKIPAHFGCSLEDLKNPSEVGRDSDHPFA